MNSVAELELQQSTALCQRVAKSQAKHFYYGLRFLDEQKREALFAIYAFLRKCDDLSDDVKRENPQAAFEQWRLALSEAYEGKTDRDPILPAFAKAVSKYQIPRSLFEDLIEGTESDLKTTRYENFEQLHLYCYRVASTVGLMTIQVLGAKSEISKEAAKKLGLAFQLTNILRDIREDASMGRIYIPLEDLRRFRVSQEDILQGRNSDGFVRLMQFEAIRAQSFYNAAAPLLTELDFRSRLSIAVMARIYRALLNKIERKNFQVLTAPVRLSQGEKVWQTTKAVLSPSFG